MNNFGKIDDFRLEHKKIILFAKALRIMKENKQTDWQEAAEWHMKYSNLHGKKTLALTVTLSPVGCQWARKGGCTMCGEFEGADRRPKILENPQFHISQFVRAISNPEIYKVAKKEKSAVKWLRIFQEGNFLNPEEMNPLAQETILRIASQLKGIERVTIEARPQYITEESVKMLRNIFNETNVELEIGMGVEAVDDVVRNICVNKGDTLADFERSVNLLNKNNIKPLAYIIVKPPFLTEKEAIEEAVSTAIYATKIGFQRISFEPMSIHSYSLVDALFQAGCYKVPWLWSVIEIAKQCKTKGVVDFGIGGIGFYPLPTTFSHNYCSGRGKGIYTDCNDNVVKGIIRYNATHNISHLINIKPCRRCYNNWLAESTFDDQTSLKERINKQLELVESIVKNYQPKHIEEGQTIKIRTLLASGAQINYLHQNDYYDWLNGEFNEPDYYGLGFTQSVATNPLTCKEPKKVISNNQLIRQFQKNCSNLLKQALKENDTEVIKWILNDTPKGLREEYLKDLPDVFWTTPVFFRTDESALGKILEIQSPGSSWGELELMYNFYTKVGYNLRIKQPSEFFSEQLSKYLELENGESPLVYYLVDNASIPVGVRYFISQTRQSNPAIKYWGIDKYPKVQHVDENRNVVETQLKAIDSHFVRTHYYLELFAECDFTKRIHSSLKKSPYDLPPMSLFDQKAIYALPFWEKTRHFFTDEMRELFAYTVGLTSNMITLEDGRILSIEEFASLPQHSRKYYLKYAGTDGANNWGSRSVTSIEKIGREKLAALLKEKVDDYINNSRPWILQAESKGEKEDVSFFDSKTKTVFAESDQNSKYSYFYGPYGVFGGLVSYRKTNLVHGQPDTIIRLIDIKQENVKE